MRRVRRERVGAVVTPEQVEVCCDAMRESGVPDELVSEIVEALWLQGRPVRLCVSRTIPREFDVSTVDLVGRHMFRELAKGILDRGLAKRSVVVVNGDTVLGLRIDVVPPCPRYPHG